MDLEKIVRHYATHHRPKKRLELASFKIEATLADAVERAALAEDELGYRYDHQRLIRRVAIPRARVALLSAIDAIRACATFEDLHNLIRDRVRGIYRLMHAELYWYDTPLRIGAKRELPPSDKVYLHRGTRQGARALAQALGECWALGNKVKTISRHLLPPPLRDLPGDELEDILCIYRDYFTEEKLEGMAFNGKCCGPSTVRGCG